MRKFIFVLVILLNYALFTCSKKTSNVNYPTSKNDPRYLYTYASNHLANDTLEIIDHLSTEFCKCFDEKKNAIENPYIRF